MYILGLCLTRINRNEKNSHRMIVYKENQTCSDKIENKNLEDSIDPTLIFENMNYHRSPLYTIFE